MDKRINFERLAEKRVSEAIKKVRLIGNLSNRRNYDYTEAHVKQIIEALESELKNMKSKFRSEETYEDVAFSFKKS
ncbi:hypothetical protein [Paenibacillus polymyxa]|uniref:hypothetical protein n=1 Tax=Paenibacillus polymyxa TaxID=1406 RepID=UPI00057817CF|nr:hypothetical protein [Paenibacillus polymyxa]MBE3650199.1 hypothetical protein [Paenibacillus polymyxa]PNQ84892.1 hypothetical protein C1T20_17565 [Paenibacillus polymyxa]UMR36662.1 hypothetical protein MJ749_04325 [Paenibacillus polymyxa]UNL95496.1 hypothetical protein CPY53_19055 [Paenibacillus polymyxa]